MDNLKNGPRVKTMIIGVGVLVYLITAIILAKGNPEFSSAHLLIFSFITVYVYHQFRKRGHAFGILIDQKLTGLFIVSYLILAAIVFFYSSDRIDCGDGCDYDKETDQCTDVTTNAPCKIDAVGFFTHGKAIIGWSSVLFIVMLAGEAWYNTGNKAMLGTILFSFLIIVGLVVAMINIILSAGGNPNQIIEDSVDRVIKRSDILFKGGLEFSVFSLFFPDKIKLIYKGDPTDVKIQVDSNTPEPIYCSTKGVANRKEKELWQCEDGRLNRIENKCGGDWWITSDKGCLTDTFTEIYRFIFIITTVTIVLLSVYSLKYNTNMYSFDSLKPLMFSFGMILLYHFVYLVLNMTVSWTFKEAFLMQDFFSEVLKSGDGVWFKDNFCDNEILDNYNSTAEKENIDKNHKSIWDNDSISMKMKLVLNVILSFIVIGYIGIYFGNKYIYKLVPGGLDATARKVYFILITGLSVLIGLQVFYWFVSTILVDQCVIERISENSHKIKNQHQGFCKSKVQGLEIKTGDQSSSVSCEEVDLRKECMDYKQCDYDNSYSFQELFRCQLDSHGGLLFHIVLIFIPIIAFILFNTRITALFK